MLNHIADICLVCSQLERERDKMDCRHKIAEWRRELKLAAQKDFQLSQRSKVDQDDYETYSDLLDQLETSCHRCQHYGGEIAGICFLIRDYLDMLADLGPLETVETENVALVKPEKGTAKVIPIGWAEFTRRYQER